SLIISLGRMATDLYDPECSFKTGGFLGFTFTFPGGFEYSNVITVQPHESISIGENQFVLSKSPKCELRLLQTIVTSEEAQDTQKTAVDRLKAFLKEDQSRSIDVSTDYWRDFWSRSTIELDSSEIEKIWYMGMYLIGSASRKGSPAMPGLQGVWMEDYHPPWKGDYHTDLNIEMNYWPVYAANHLELAEPFYRCYTDLIPKFLEDTRNYFKADGIKLPISHDRNGNDLGGYIGGIFWQGSSAWIASHFWKNFRYSKDEDFLRETAFPFIRNCILYYNTIMEKNKTGRYIIPLSWTPEEMESDQIKAVDANPAIDISHIKNLYRFYLEAVDILGADVAPASELHLARDILRNFTDYPICANAVDAIGDTPYIMESENCDFDYTHRHLSVLTPIYPSGEFNGYSSSRENFQLGLNTFYKYMKRGNTSKRQYFSGTYTWLACVAATLGLADFANHLLSDYLDTYVNDNYLNVCFDYRKKGRGVHVGDTQEFSSGTEYVFADRIFQLETNACAAEVINLMLLQSFEGEISVFPAYPWKNGCFDGLLAEGGFVISAKLETGRLVRLTVESLLGGLCTVYLDKDITEISVVQSNGDEVSHTELEMNDIGNRKRFSFETCPGSGYDCVVKY
ncbi:MAG: hypothetical protein HN368_00745, partial [Spirochaetales bacterium]|nr:hypothetical protein [Spirochaetales bacterium]